MRSEPVWAVALLAALIVLVVMLGIALLEVFGLLRGTCGLDALPARDQPDEANRERGGRKGSRR